MWELIRPANTESVSSEKCHRSVFCCIAKDLSCMHVVKLSESSKICFRVRYQGLAIYEIIKDLIFISVGEVLSSEKIIKIVHHPQDFSRMCHL